VFLNRMGHSEVSEFYMLFSIIYNQLYLYFNFEVKFIRRQANMIAYSLTKAVSS